jgi:hypothetical protein
LTVLSAFPRSGFAPISILVGELLPPLLLQARSASAGASLVWVVMVTMPLVSRDMLT